MSKKKLKVCIPGMDWEVEETITKTGAIDNTYYFKGERSIKIPLEGMIATRMAGYTLINHDLRMILAWLKMLIDEYNKLGLDKAKQTVVHITPEINRDKFDELKAFMVAAVTFYGKLFTKADGRKVKLEVNLFGANPKYIQIHNEVMMYRHNFSAHSGQAKVEYVEVYLVLDSKKERATRPLIARIMNQPNAFTNKFIDNFIEVCKYLLAKMDDKLVELNSDFYKNLTPERYELYYKITSM